MKMIDSIRIAIRHRPGSFSNRWIEYCNEKNLSYCLIDGYSNNIISQLESFDVLLWNWFQGNYVECLCASHILKAAEKMGLVVFPSSDTCWTFDNKLAQKYQLESIGSPLVPTYIFYDDKSAIEWLKETNFPKVFKLRRGAGSMNVRLVRNYKEGFNLIRKSFSSGFKCSSGHIRENFSKFTSKITRRNYDWLTKIKRLPNTLLNIYRTNKMFGREIGYIYFQDFIPNLGIDTRVVVIGNRAFAFQREVRENDFRASGSGLIDPDPKKINLNFVKIAFETSSKLNLQCAAYDIVSDQNNRPLILEVSYTFPSDTKFQVKDCPGYWDSDLNWHKGPIWPQDAILEDILSVLMDK